MSVKSLKSLVIVHTVYEIYERCVENEYNVNIVTSIKYKFITRVTSHNFA